MSKEDRKKILVIGIGNIGRQDDGLGWLILDHIVDEFKFVDTEYRYQLQIEDAELASNYSMVIFADATKEQVDDGFYFKNCKVSKTYGMSTHAVHPETIVGLTNNLYHKYPEVFILGIQGHHWELKEGVSEKALDNLNKAIDFLPNIFSRDLDFSKIYKTETPKP